MGRNYATLAYRYITKKPLIFTVLLSFVMAVLLYRDFILSGIPLFMTATDGWAHAWPYMAAMSDYIRTYGIPQWHFGIGMGSVFPINLNPFWIIPVLLGRDIIPHFMVWVQISRIVLACFFFYLYLRKLKLHPCVCSLISILFAFCGHMILRGANWVIYGTEIVMVAFLLYAVEVYFSDRKWYPVPVAVCLIGVSLGSIYLYLYGLILIAYATVRYVHANRFKLRDYTTYMLKCGLLYVIGVFAASVIIIPPTVAMWFSARTEDAVGRIGLRFIYDNLFEWDQSILLTAFFRFFSPNSLGNAMSPAAGFGGWINPLEAPLHYAGLVIILLIPIFFFYAGKKLRIITAIGLSFAALYYLSPVFRGILIAFGSLLHFKISSFWITIIILLMAAFTLNKIIIKEKKLRFDFPVISWIGLLILYFGFELISGTYRIRVDSYTSVLVLMLLSAYTLVLYFYTRNDVSANGSIGEKRGGLIALLFVFCVFEIFKFSSITTTYFFDRQAVQTVNALAEEPHRTLGRDELFTRLNEMDDSFFRVGQRGVEATAPMLQNYFGSSHYDSSLSVAYINFLRETNPGFIEFQIDMGDIGGIGGGSSPGIENRPILKTLTAHKYVVVNHEHGEAAPFGFTYFFTEDDRSVYINDYYLPLGFAYDSFITREQFEALQSQYIMDLAMLKSVVLETPNKTISDFNLYELKNLVQYVGISSVDEMEYRQLEDVQNNLPVRFEATATGNDPGIVIPIHSEDRLKQYAISLEITPEGSTTVQIYWASEDEMFSEEKSFSQSVIGGEQTTVTVTIENSNLYKIRIDPGMRTGNYILENLVIMEVDAPSVYSLYARAVDARRTEAFEMDHFSHRRITGSIETFGDRVLFFSIPHAEGWKMYINGEQVPIETVNIGFIGTTVGAGVHDIELRFRMPGLIVGIVMSSIGVVAYAVLFALDKSGKAKWLDVDLQLKAM